MRPLSPSQGRYRIEAPQAYPRVPSVQGEAMTVIDEIAAERARQIEQEGWTAEHDDDHDAGELAAAGASYAINAADQLSPLSQGDGENLSPIMWPWAWEWWKPKNPRRDLIRAAALIVAEIERMDRVTPPTELADSFRELREDIAKLD